MPFQGPCLKGHGPGMPRRISLLKKYSVHYLGEIYIKIEAKIFNIASLRRILKLGKQYYKKVLHHFLGDEGPTGRPVLPLEFLMGILWAVRSACLPFFDKPEKWLDLNVDDIHFLLPAWSVGDTGVVLRRLWRVRCTSLTSSPEGSGLVPSFDGWARSCSRALKMSTVVFIPMASDSSSSKASGRLHKIPYKGTRRSWSTPNRWYKAIRSISGISVSFPSSRIAKLRTSPNSHFWQSSSIVVQSSMVQSKREYLLQWRQ